MAAPPRKIPVDENDDFIRLIQVAQNDPQMHRQLLAILSLDSFHRGSVLNSWLEQLRRQNAPVELIRAIGCLTDAAISDKALGLLKPSS